MCKCIHCTTISQPLLAQGYKVMKVSLLADKIQFHFSKHYYYSDSDSDSDKENEGP